MHAKPCSVFAEAPAYAVVTCSRYYRNAAPQYLKVERSLLFAHL